MGAKAVGCKVVIAEISNGRDDFAWMEAQAAVLESLLEASDELAAKNATKHLDGEKKSRA